MNDKMQHARDVALNILKPSQRDIEHGLELHEHALVIESYGLGLRSPVRFPTPSTQPSKQARLTANFKTSPKTWA